MPESLGTPEEERTWLMESIDVAFWAFKRYEEATTVGQQASAFEEVSNALHDVWTYHPEWDFETGIIGEH